MDNCFRRAAKKVKRQYISVCLLRRSIVLIDELGAATSTSDGIAIAWAVSEHLISEGTQLFYAIRLAVCLRLAPEPQGVCVCHVYVIAGHCLIV